MSKQIDGLKKQIKDGKEAVALGEALERLENNKDFKLVFLDRYFESFASGLVRSKTKEGRSPEETTAIQVFIDQQINAIAYLGKFLETVESSRLNAASNIPEQQELLESLRVDEGVVTHGR